MAVPLGRPEKQAAALPAEPAPRVGLARNQRSPSSRVKVTLSTGAAETAQKCPDCARHWLQWHSITGRSGPVT